MTLTAADFDRIKAFILQHGDRKTYCNMCNHNPHYRFEGFDAYLHPDIFQGNVNCDPKLSDFDELVLYDGDQYLRLEKVAKPLPGRVPDLHYERRHQALLQRYVRQMLRTIDTVAGMLRED